MKMADSEKAEEFVDAECPSERFDEAQSATTSVQDEHLKTETTTSTSSPAREKEDDSPLYTEGEQSLLSLPCLMKELRRDSPESQQASTGSEKPASRHIYESDSSNPCMLSPSSSGHLADSDTLSSCAEGAGEETETKMEADPAKEVDRQTSGRKSRRSRSESEAPPNAMAAKKNRCQPAGASGPEKQINGKQAKVKGHRSQKHKERMRLLRQKREAAARKKYNLLQDSSTSDSELTCDSSTSSSSDDDDDTSGGSKTIKTDIPGHAAVETSHKDGRQHKVQISIGSSDSEVEIVGVQENARCAHPCGGVIKSLSSWKDDHSAERSASANTTTTTQPPPQRWTCVSPQSSWVSPPEVVDLTLDEESSGHKHIP
ncbi:protein C18orf25 homolog isoform X3 [Hippocampus zosterae]|uniref:protein C18orf25 homolog isoform X3 n=1 Tax=Hippocampus zosterae TaxID=109293 RepID=UPI00223D5499|nr:protein C18orf25 homolog isoform X3 [Hippocampus zosterae]